MLNVAKMLTANFEFIAEKKKQNSPLKLQEAQIKTNFMNFLALKMAKCSEASGWAQLFNTAFR
jgi:hypothetical protein